MTRMTLTTATIATGILITCSAFLPLLPPTVRGSPAAAAASDALLAASATKDALTGSPAAAEAAAVKTSSPAVVSPSAVNALPLASAYAAPPAAAAAAASPKGLFQSDETEDAGSRGGSFLINALREIKEALDPTTGKSALFPYSRCC